MGSGRLEHLLLRERAGLASYACRAGDSRGRVASEPDHPYRTAFQRDRDRIVHATAFRRLEHKTQVFVSGEGDHYRTRLTHTLEAAQIARTLARALALNEDLTEAIALAHDLGHAPFGHAGGEALREVMAGHGGFDHNRQALRVVSVLERRHAERPGLNLTYEVREAIVKHGFDPSTRTPDEGERVVPERDAFEPQKAPTLEAQLVDHADSIAYDAHDLDDGLRSGLIAVAEARSLALWRRGQAAAEARHGELRDPEVERHAVIRRIIDLLATDLVETTESRLERLGVCSVDDVRARGAFLVGLQPALQEERAELQRFLLAALYRHHRVMRIWLVAKRWLTRLFEAYTAEALLLPPKWRAWCDEVGRHRAACDYLAGMTDRYAAREARRLFSPSFGLADV